MGIDKRQLCGDPIMEGSKVYMADRIGLDGKPTKRLIIEGTAIVCDVPGINGRAYPKRIIAREVNRLNKDSVPFGRLAAELNHPRLDDEGTAKDYPIFEMNLSKTCAVVEELRMDGNKLYCRMVVAEGTPAGDTLAGLIRAGYHPGYSLRGAGDTTVQGDHEVITDNYTMITIDVVGNPSFGSSAIFDAHVESVNTKQGKALTEAIIGNYGREVQHRYVQAKLGYCKFNKEALAAELRRIMG